MAKNFLKSNVDEINNKKKQVELCNKCMKNNLPQYNMGFNQKLWKKYAKDKILNDVGSK